MAVAIGSRVGVYEITGHLGAGGMGEVFRARDPRIGREVAVKMLPSELTGNAERLRRFEQEARAAGALNHPNLITVHEMGMHEGAPYLVMELLDGETLREKLGETGTATSARIPIRKSMEYAQQLASGLAAAHEKGIVHRDLKPDNVVITRDGRLKILDFGLAKLGAGQNGSGDASATEARHTTPGTILGTAGYMSPEQVRGYETDQRTDIFSFGVILYEMLSGRRAFRGDSAADTMSAILHEDPPELSSSSGQHIPPAVDRVIRRCMEKERTERFGSARDLAFALDAVTSSGISHEQIAPGAPSRSRKTSLAVTIAVALAAAAAAALLTWRATRVPVQPAAVQSSFAQLTFDAGTESHPSIAPDGKTFAFVKGTSPHRMIYVQRVDGRSAIPLSKSADDDDHDPAFSPDGDEIAFRSSRDGGGIFVMGATGESVRRVTSTGYEPAWSPDGSQIVFCSEEIAAPTSRNSISSLSTVTIATGTVRSVYAGDAVQPTYSPGGKRIAYWALRGNGGQRDLFTIAANGDPKSVVSLTEDAALDWNPMWAPDGKWVFFSSDRSGTMNLWRMPVDEESGRATGAPEPLGAPAAWAGAISIAHDGRHLAYVSSMSTEDLRRTTFDPATGKASTEPAPMFAGSMLVRDASLSADGQWVAFTTESKQEDLYVMRSDGKDLRQLTSDVHRDRGPSWAADGSRIFFYSTRAGEYDAWSIRPDGSGLTRVTSGAMVNFPILSPDGKRLTFFDLSHQRIATMQGDQGLVTDQLPPLPGTSDPFFARAWSPDGSRLAGTQWLDRDNFHVYTFATKSYRKVGSGDVVEWIDDHRVLSASQNRLTMTNVDTGQSTVVGTIPGVSTFIAPGGRLIVSGGIDTESDVWRMTIGEADHH